MSSDELKRKTVCLKLAKNGIYLCKNPSNAKFVPSRDVAFGLKQLKDYSQQSKAEVTNTEPPPRKPEKSKKEPEEETVLQKFIRGFDCGEFCDDDSSGVGECSSGAFDSSDSLGGTSQDRKRVQVSSEPSASGSRPHCRVEFITPAKTGDNASRETVKPMKPLVVDLSQKKFLLKDNPIKIVKSTPNELRQLNRNFITPKVKVENFSHCSDSSSLPLIISPAETPDFSGSSSSRSPYPSTKIEIDYTGSSIQDDRYADQGFPCPVKSERGEYGQSPKTVFGHDNEFILPDNEGFDDAYRNFNNMIQHNAYWNNVGQSQSYNVAPQHASNVAPQHASNVAPQHASNVAPQHASNVAPQHASNVHQQQSYNSCQPPSYSVNLHQPYTLNQHQSNVNHLPPNIGYHQPSNITHHQSFNVSQHQSYNNMVQQQSHKNANQHQSYGHPHHSLVMSKCGNDAVSPMINPQILDFNGMAEVVMSSMKQQDEPQPPRKKRKYTRKASSKAAASSSSLPSLSPSSSLYNFLSSL